MGDFATQAVFYIFALLAVLGGLGIVVLRNPVHAALSLGMVFISLAAMYILLSAPFIAAAQVMIYAGAILILFLFVIMVLNPRIELSPGTLPGQGSAAVIVGLALIVVIAVAVLNGHLAPPNGPFTPEVIAQAGHAQIIGQLLFTDFLLPFEITSLLILVAIIGVISLAKKG